MVVDGSSSGVERAHGYVFVVWLVFRHRYGDRDFQHGDLITETYTFFSTVGVTEDIALY